MTLRCIFVARNPLHYTMEYYDHAFYAVNAITDNNCGRDNDSEFFGLRMQIRFYGIGKDGI
nr:hypothetical protein [Butyrivibrio sp. WCE2006]